MQAIAGYFGNTVSFFRLLIIILIATAITGCAEVEVKNVEIKMSAASFFVDDFIINVTANVTNKGKTGEFKVNAKLSCSEGEWEKTRTYYLSENVSQKVEFSFSEPSVSTLSSDYTAIVTVSLW